MRSRVGITAIALACLWASAAWSAPVPSDDGTGFSLAPGSAATTGILDPSFRSTSLADILWEPPATIVPFRFSKDDITVSGFASDMLTAPDAPEQSGWSLRDIMVSAELAPGVDFNLAQGRDLAAMGAFGGGADVNGGLFLATSGARSSYLPLTNGGAYAGLTFHLTDDLQLRLGHATLGTQAAARESLLANPGINALPPQLALQLAASGRSAETTAAGVDWNFADWGNLGITASQTKESTSLLGDLSANSVAVADAIQTAALGISARVGFGAGWVTKVSYTVGLSQLDLRPNSLLPSPVSLRSQAYGISIAKQGLLGNDMLGLTVSRPLQVYGQGNGFIGASNFGDNNDLLFNNNTPGLLAGAAPESDIELGYVTSFLGGALALQANAAYQVNAGGQKGQDAVTVVSRAKINF